MDYILDYYVAIEPYSVFFNQHYEFKEESYVHSQEKILVGQQPVYGCDQYGSPPKEEFFLVRSPNGITGKFKDNRVYTTGISLESDVFSYNKQKKFTNFYNGISKLFFSDKNLKNRVIDFNVNISDKQFYFVSLECKEEDWQLLSDKKDRGFKYSMPYEPYRREGNRLYYVVDYIRDDNQPHSGVGLYISRFGENFNKDAVNLFLKRINDRTILNYVYGDPQYRFLSHTGRGKLTFSKN